MRLAYLLAPFGAGSRFVAPEDELGCDSLTPIAAIKDRVREWNSISGK